MIRPTQILLRLMPCAATALLLGIAPATASNHEEARPFGEAQLFFELNNTDGDLGIHAKIDGDPWKQLWIMTPDESVLLSVTARGNLRRQGMTEIAFESAEPPFSELAPKDFLKRFPEGTYEVEAIMLDGGELESDVEISHVLPAPPQFLGPAGPCSNPVAVTAPITIAWNPVTQSHPTIGRPGVAVEVERYEVAFEVVGGDLKFFAELPPDVTSIDVPELFTEEPGVIKFEVLVKAADGNRTAEERCVRVL